MEEIVEKKEKYPGFNYIVEREKWAHATGDWRCEQKVAGENKCLQQCKDCFDIYFKENTDTVL